MENVIHFLSNIWAMFRERFFLKVHIKDKSGVVYQNEGKGNYLTPKKGVGVIYQQIMVTENRQFPFL